MIFDATARDEYRALFRTCQVIEKRKEEVEHGITTIMRGGARYAAVGDECGVPWYVVGILHHLEASCSFNHHLHNGDPLCSRTKNVPVGRPEGVWPLPGASADVLWTTSALDALAFQKFDQWHNWTTEGILYCFERYNGFGYRKHGLHSAYLWGGSNHAAPGKYVADGKWSPTAESKQIGAAVILRRMVDQALVEIPAA